MGQKNFLLSDAAASTPFEFVTDAIVIVDCEGRIAHVNSPAEKLFGYHSNELLQRPIELVVPRWFEGVRRGLRVVFIALPKLRPPEAGVQLQALRKDGTQFPLVCSVIRETADWEVQEALPSSEARYRRLFETAKDGILLLDANTGQVTDVNPFMCNLLGYSRGELLGRQLWEIGAFKDIDASRSAFRELQQKEYIRYENLPLQTRANELIQVEFVSNVYQVGAHRVIQCNIRDVSDRKRTQIESEERYRVLFEQDTAGDYIAGPDGKLLACNAAFAHMFGFPSIEEAKQAGIVSLYRDSEQYEAFLERLKERKKLSNYEQELRRKDGTPLLIVARVIGVFDQDGALHEIHGYLFDESERRRSEEEIRQAHKMDAVGRLAGGIAHDFNNLLGVVTGYTQLSLDALKSDDPIRQNLLEIQQAANSGAALTQQLLAFTRQQVLQPIVLDLNAVVGEADKLLRPLIGEDIEMVVNLQADLGQVKTDPTQVMQVMLNLATNARDSMPGGGKLTIETTNVNVDGNTLESARAPQAGRYVALRVTDTGVGMSKETQSRIFDPFFTTKGAGQGTGLGLATVYGIVNQSGAHISVKSGLGQGTSFEILFPRVGENGEFQLHQVEAPPAQSPGGSETILLVEDTAQLRKLVRRVLEITGYKVLTAGSSEEAVQVASEYRGEIHLVLSDVVLPGVSGPVLVERLLSMRPEIKVLFMSGYAQDKITQYRLSQEGFSFIRKPFKPAALASKVRQVLDDGGCATNEASAD